MNAWALLFAATFAIPMERVSTMDGALARSIYDMRAVQIVHETPLDVDYEARPYKLVPGYCEMPETSADGLKMVLKTRHGPARYVVKALERLRDPEIVSPNGWIMDGVKTVRALDERTVEIGFSKPIHHFPWLLAMGAVAIVDDNGEGTGAYRLKSWWKNHEMIFERREKSEKGFDEVRYLVVDDMSTQWLMFLRGEVDVLQEISRDTWDSIMDENGELKPELKARGITLQSRSTMEILHIGLNMRDPILGKNKKLRQALNCAFDFPEWKKFNNNRIVECNTPVPEGVKGRLESRHPYHYDLERAKKLMVEAGYPDGIDPKTGRRLVLTMAMGRANQESREAGELIASFYAKIGIKLELDFMTWDAFLKAVNEGRAQMFRMGWVGDYPDAQDFLQLFYGPNAAPGSNHANYVNAEYDRAFEAEDWEKCQEIVREDCPWIFTHFNISHTLVGPRVGNYRTSDFQYGTEQYYEYRVH